MTALRLTLLLVGVVCLWVSWMRALRQIGERPDDQLGPSERGWR